MTSDDFSSQAKKLNQSDYAQRPTKSLFLQYKAKKSLLVLVIPLGKNQGERAIFIFFFAIFLLIYKVADLISPLRWVSSDIQYSRKEIIVDTHAAAQMKGLFMLI